MLTIGELGRFLMDDGVSDQKRGARLGQRYYEGRHDILHYRMFYYTEDGTLVEDRARANRRIPHPFFTELVDQLAAYMLSGDGRKVGPVDEGDTELAKELDGYFDGAFWSEISDLITGAYAKGYEYLYAYRNAAGRLSFQCANSLGVVEVRKQDTDDGCEYVIYHYTDRIDKGRKKITRIQVWSREGVEYYVRSGNGHIARDKDAKLNPRPHVILEDEDGQRYQGPPLGYVPFWRLDYDKQRHSGLLPIKALIDDYDLMECGLSNNLQDFDTPLYAVTGFLGDDLTELQQNLKTKKIVGLDEGGGVEVKTVDVPYEARKAKADEDEKNIYRFGMGFNSNQTGDGNITNVVIRSRYTLIDLKANKLEKRLRSLLEDILGVVLTEVNQRLGSAYSREDVRIEFRRSVPANEQENAQIALTRAQETAQRVTTLLNASSILGEETARKAVCALLELDYDEVCQALEMAETGSAAGALGLLDQVPVDG